MKIKVLLFCLLSNLFAQAQISILNADMPKVNDALRYSTTTTKINLDSTGENYTWDFSNIVVSNQDVQTFTSPLQTPYLLQFLSATYGIPETGQALSQAGGIASNIYAFYKTSNTAQVILGRGATVQSLPLGIVYSLRDTVFKYPLTYGMEYSGNYLGEAGLTGLGTLKQVGNRHTLVDGWGSITTPYGTFDCIRVKSEITETDSIVFNGFGIPIPNNSTVYTWLAKGEKYPILEVIVNTLTGIVTSTKYKDIYRPEAYVNNCNFSASRLTGKPGDTITLSDNSFGKPKTYAWQITPATFTYASGSNATSASPKVIFSATGNYSIKLSVTYEGASDDTLKTNYIKIAESIVANFEASNIHPALSETVTFTESSTGNPTSYLWSFTPATGFIYVNGTSSISQNPQLQFIVPGNYSVSLRASNAGATNTHKKTDYIQVWATGLKGIEEKPFASIFPNPAKSFLQINMENLTPASVKIYSILGEQVYSNTFLPSSETGISVGQLPKGLYFIEIKQKESVLTQRLILE